MHDEDADFGEYASPPCYAHELDPLQREFAIQDRNTRNDIMRWRKAERTRLYALRKTLNEAQRARELTVVCAALDDLLTNTGCRTLSAYWPVRDEPDLRAWMRKIDDAGIVVALPVIRPHSRVLDFSRWRPDGDMKRGVWGIAEPAVDDRVVPDLIIAPLLGVDRRGYRLGNGGGYFDRSLATIIDRPTVVGVGFGCARIDTIYPLSHDIPMDVVITGAGEQGRS